MNTCKTCEHWKMPGPDEVVGDEMCVPIDPDTMKPMKRGFEVRFCKLPTQTFCEAPVERDGFGLADASTYSAVLATAEDFGCMRHMPRTQEEIAEEQAEADFNAGAAKAQAIIREADRPRTPASEITREQWDNACDGLGTKG